MAEAADVISVADSAASQRGVLATLTADRIRCRVYARDWREVVQLTGDLLERCGCTQPRYTAAMRELIEQLGPYMVIAPGIVLLHARPEDGVLRECLVLLTLAEPVPFGHTQNDPVWLVVGLAGANDRAHVDALAEIALILAVPEAIEALRVAVDTESILAAITTYRATALGLSSEPAEGAP
jgi:PTS system ascorbate-specific IIA component